MKIFMKKTIVQVLHKIKNDFGVSVFSDPARFKSALMDVRIETDAKPIRNLLDIAVCDMKAYSRLESARSGNNSFILDNLVSEMSSDYRIGTRDTQIVISCIAELLGYKNSNISPPDSIPSLPVINRKQFHRTQPLTTQTQPKINSTAQLATHLYKKKTWKDIIVENATDIRKIIYIVIGAFIYAHPGMIFWGTIGQFSGEIGIGIFIGALIGGVIGGVIWKILEEYKPVNELIISAIAGAIILAIIYGWVIEFGWVAMIIGILLPMVVGGGIYIYYSIKIDYKHIFKLYLKYLIGITIGMICGMVIGGITGGILAVGIGACIGGGIGGGIGEGIQKGMITVAIMCIGLQFVWAIFGLNGIKGITVTSL